ncbi:GNAT family N-acetyltransferase [Allokutzneria oryzae]|uniref:GNAT family N-acetyltransferase n=1 Tax=Allokutzneria oryzae TaxID=1378989 RepID=A0ABV5ZSZ9_9PSEU
MTELITEWLRGWTAVRGLTDVRPTLAAAIAVRVGRGGRTVEYVVTTPGLDPEWLRAAILADGGSPMRDWVTIPLTDDQPAEPPPGFDWARPDVEWLMRYDPADSEAPTGVDGYAFAAETLPSGAVRVACTSTKDGSEAGAASLVVLDGFGVIDAVEVAEQHRRKGLASQLMRQLHLIAVEQKAERLVLVASPEGKALYESLGWQVACRAVITTVV